MRPPRPTAERRTKKAKVRGLGKLLSGDWWPLEAAVIWLATGDVEPTRLAFEFVIARRSSPAGKFPSLAMWLMTYEGSKTLYEAQPGAVYRASIRGDWRPGDRESPHPLDNATAETAAILRGRPSSKRGRALEMRRLARGKQRGEEVDWIPSRAWSGSVVDDRKRGMILVPDTKRQSDPWVDIDILAAPFKALGADRGRQTIAQRNDLLAIARKNNDRVKARLAKHDETMGRAVKKRRGRPKGSTNIQH